MSFRKLTASLSGIAAAMSLLAGFAISALAIWTWLYLLPPMKAAIRTSEQAIGTIRASAAQLRKDLETLPPALLEAERASASTAQALRALHNDLPGIFAQVEATGKMISETGAGVASTASILRSISDNIGMLDNVESVKAARKDLYVMAGTLEMVQPRTKQIASTVMEISQRQLDPMQSALRDSAAASDSSARSLETLRLGVLQTLPQTLTGLADSLDSTVRSLRAIPMVVDVLVALALAFGVGFLASGLRQCIVLVQGAGSAVAISETSDAE